MLFNLSIILNIIEGTDKYLLIDFSRFLKKVWVRLVGL